MKVSSVPSATAAFVVIVVAVALIALQVSNAAKDLVVCLPAYAAIAACGLLSQGILASRGGGNFSCLASSLAFFGYASTRALLSPAEYASRPDLYCILAALALYGIVTNALVASTPRISLLALLLAFAVVHVLVSVIQAGWGQNLIALPSLENVEQNGRASGLFVNPDHLAGLLEILGAFGLSIACWSRWPGWSKVCFGYLAAICYFGVALTGSRGGYASVLVSLAVFAFLSLLVLKSGGLGLALKFGGTGLLVLVLALFSVGYLIQHYAPLRDRVESAAKIDEGRRDLWAAAIQQWKLQPVIGTGSGTYRFYGREFRTASMQLDPVDVHNDYLHLLCEYGLIGAVGFLVFFGTHLRHGWRGFQHLGPRRLAAGFTPLSDRLALNIGALCVIAAYIIHSAVDFNLHIPANALLIAFTFGILANPGIEEKSEPSRAARIVPRLALPALAIILLLQCARLYPGEYFGERARVSLLAEKPSDSIAFAKRALTFEQKNPNIYFYLGRALIAEGNAQDHTPEDRTSFLEQGLAALEKALRLVPLDGTYPLAMAYTYDRMKRFAEAEQMYQLALARDPHSETVVNQYQYHRDAQAKEKASH